MAARSRGDLGAWLTTVTSRRGSTPCSSTSRRTWARLCSPPVVAVPTTTVALRASEHGARDRVAFLDLEGAALVVAVDVGIDVPDDHRVGPEQ